MYYRNSGLHPLRGMRLKFPVIVAFAAAFAITTLSEVSVRTFTVIADNKFTDIFSFGLFNGFIHISCWEKH